MKKAVIIGGAGHIGSYLIPELVDKGYKVYSLSRGNRTPYTAGRAQWKEVTHIKCDRSKMVAEGTFGQMVAEMRPDILCDLISYNISEIHDLCEPIMADSELCEKTTIFQIGSIWVYGHKIDVPVTEDHERTGFCEYGINKAEIERYLLQNAGNLKATVIHPGHISGREWTPINPQGNLNPKIYTDIVQGREILLPDDGMGTLQHVHSYDIARLITACIDNPGISIGETFHSVCAKAITLRGFAERLFEHYGHKPKIAYAPFEKFKEMVGAKDADCSSDHIRHSPVCSMEKAKELLSFEPKYGIVDIAIEAISFQSRR